MYFDIKDENKTIKNIDNHISILRTELTMMIIND